MQTEIRESTGMARRGLMLAGAGLLLGTAGLVLPGSLEETDARGALGGSMGGRHGQDHRGRNKHRGKNRNDKDREPREEGIFASDGVDAFIINATPSDIVIDHGNGDPTYVIAPGARGEEGRYFTYYSIFATIRNKDYSIELENPEIGRPSVTIKNLTSGVTEFDESLSVDQEVAGYTFKVKRLADYTVQGSSQEYKQFEITAL